MERGWIRRTMKGEAWNVVSEGNSDGDTRGELSRVEKERDGRGERVMGEGDRVSSQPGWN